MRKINLLAVFLSCVVLFASCSNGFTDFGKKQSKETGKIAFTMDKAALAKMVSKAQMSTIFADVSEDLDEPEEELTDLEEEELTDLEKEALYSFELIVKGSENFYEIKSFEFSKGFFDSEKDESEDEDDVADKTEKTDTPDSIVFDNLPSNQTYTVFALVNIEGVTLGYGKTEGVEIIPEETVPVNVKMSFLDEDDEQAYAILPKTQVTVSGNVDKEKEHNYYFALDYSSILEKSDTEIYGFDEYPVTFTLTFSAENATTEAKLFNAKEELVKAYDKTNGECKVDITLTQEDKAFAVFELARSNETQAVCCYFVEIENGVGKKPAVEEDYEESKYAMFSLYENKGIYLQESPFDYNGEPLNGTNNGNFTSFQFDAYGQLWYIDNNDVYIDGSKTDFSSSFSGYKPLAVTCDIVTKNIYIVAKNGYYFNLLKFVKAEDAPDKYNGTVKQISSQYLFSGITGNPVRAFAAYNDHLFMSIGDSFIYYMENMESDSFANINTCDAVDGKLTGEKFVVNDITVEGGVLYAIVGASATVSYTSLANITSGDYDFSQRGFVAAYDFGEDDFGDFELTLSEDFNSGSVYGWTDDVLLKNSNSYYSLEYYAPSDKNNINLFGGNNRFIGRQHGKLVFTDAGLYVDTSVTFSNTRRVFVLNIETYTVDIYDVTDYDLGLDKNYQQSLLYLLINGLFNSSSGSNNPFPPL